ncbi:MAG: hypothetical protein RR140_01095 [Clostridia bacterium]
MKEGLAIGLIIGAIAGALIYKNSAKAKEVINKGESAIKKEISNLSKKVK